MSLIPGFDVHGYWTIRNLNASVVLLFFGLTSYVYNGEQNSFPMNNQYLATINVNKLVNLGADTVMTAMFENCCPKISVTFKSNLTIIQKYSGIYEFSGQSTVLGEHVHVICA